MGGEAGATECGASPNRACHPLKRRGGNLGARGRHANDDRLAPAAMAGFQRLPRHSDVTGAVEGIIGTADLVGVRFCLIDEMVDHVLAEILWTDKLGHTKTLARRLAVIR